MLVFLFSYLLLGAIPILGTMFPGILGWIVAIIMASAALFCGIGIGLTVILFFLFYENLLSPLN